MCDDFRRGLCNRGASCKFSHGDGGGAGGGGYDSPSLDPAALQALADRINGVPSADGGGVMGQQSGVQDPSSLYVKDLPLHVDDLWLYKVFAPHGAVERVRALPRDDGGGCKGIGFVKFVRADEAATAIASVNGQPTFDGSRIGVAVKKPPKGAGKGYGKDAWGGQSVPGQSPSSVTLAGPQADDMMGYAAPPPQQELGWTQGWDASAQGGQAPWDASVPGGQAPGVQAPWDASAPGGQAPGGQVQWDTSAAGGQPQWDASAVAGQTEWNVPAGGQADTAGQVPWDLVCAEADRQAEQASWDAALTAPEAQPLG